MRQRNHAPRFEEIAKMKLQAFRPSNPKSLQSQTSLRSKNRLPLNGLEGVHGRQMNRVGRRTIFALLLIDTATRIWGRSATLYFLGTNTDEVFATTKLR